MCFSTLHLVSWCLQATLLCNSVAMAVMPVTVQVCGQPAAIYLMLLVRIPVCILCTLYSPAYVACTGAHSRCTLAKSLFRLMSRQQTKPALHFFCRCSALW